LLEKRDKKFALKNAKIMLEKATKEERKVFSENRSFLLWM